MVIIENNSKRYQFKNSNTVYKIGNDTAKFSDIKTDQEVKITYVTTSDNTAEGTAKTIENYKFIQRFDRICDK